MTFEQIDQVVVTSRKITSGEKPIRLVILDMEGGWMFLTGENFSMQEAQLVTLQSLIQVDSSLSELSDLPCGHSAIRDSGDESWVRTEDSH